MTRRFDPNAIPVPRHREPITEEHEPGGDHHDPHHQDVDWIGYAQQGGGRVPADFEWTTNPRHDRLIAGRGN